MCKGKVEFYNSKKRYGFIKVESEPRDLFFSDRGFRRLEYQGLLQPRYEFVEPPPIEQGTCVEVLEIAEVEKGRLATQWTIPFFNPPQPPEVYYLVEKTHEIEESEPQCDNDRHLYRVHIVERIVERIVFVGTYDECKARELHYHELRKT